MGVAGAYYICPAEYREGFCCVSLGLDPSGDKMNVRMTMKTLDNYVPKSKTTVILLGKIRQMNKINHKKLMLKVIQHDLHYFETICKKYHLAEKLDIGKATSSFIPFHAYESDVLREFYGLKPIRTKNIKAY